MPGRKGTSLGEQVTVCVPDSTLIVTRHPEHPSQNLDWKCQVQCKNVRALEARVLDEGVKEACVSPVGERVYDCAPWAKLASSAEARSRPLP